MGDRGYGGTIDYLIAGISSRAAEGRQVWNGKEGPPTEGKGSARPRSETEDHGRVHSATGPNNSTQQCCPNVERQRLNNDLIGKG